MRTQQCRETDVPAQKECSEESTILKRNAIRRIKQTEQIKKGAKRS